MDEKMSFKNRHKVNKLFKKEFIKKIEISADSEINKAFNFTKETMSTKNDLKQYSRSYQ